MNYIIPEKKIFETEQMDRFNILIDKIVIYG